MELLVKAEQHLKTRELSVGPRQDYFEGRHSTSRVSSKAWNESFGKILSGIIDNQSRLVCEHRAEAVRPVAYTAAEQADTLSKAAATGLTATLEKHADLIDDYLKQLYWSGEPCSLLVDYDTDGAVRWYMTDPRDIYVQQDAAGTYLSAVRFWQDNSKQWFATTWTTETITVYASDKDSKTVRPSADSFKLVDEYPNAWGDIPVVTAQTAAPLIDLVKPQNDLLNKSLQAQNVAGEGYVLPLTLYFGFDLYDPETGEHKNLAPNTNPATASRDIAIPAITDEEGGQRQVIRLDSPDPGRYLEEQDNLRASIARLASVPAFMLQIGGSFPSGEALEMAYMPFLAAKQADERRLRPFFARLGELTVKRITGQELPVSCRVVYSTATTSTLTSRVQQMATAVAAGMPLAEALTEFLGYSREAADAVAAEALKEHGEQAVAGIIGFSAGAE